jgi:hypothetical protein
MPPRGFFDASTNERLREGLTLDAQASPIGDSDARNCE